MFYAKMTFTCADCSNLVVMCYGFIFVHNHLITNNMARIVTHSKSSVIRSLRRQYKTVGYTVRVTNEQAFVMKLPTYNYIRTPKQDESRERFRRAQELASQELNDPERFLYWQSKAKRQARYKTVRGYCIAYWYKRLKEMDLEEAKRQFDEIQQENNKAVANGEIVVDEQNKLRSFAYQSAIYGTKTAEEIKSESKADG